MKIVRGNFLVILKIFLFSFLFIFTLNIPNIYAATYYVNSNCSLGCDGSSLEKGWNTIAEATSSSNVPSGSTVDFATGSGPYYEKFIPSTDQDNVTWNFNGVEIRSDVNLNDLVDTGDYSWISSSDSNHNGEYYFVKNGSNILDNGDMESDDSWNDYYTVTVNEQSDVRVHEGNFSRHVVANYGGISRSITTLASGRKYKLSGYYYLETGSMTVYFFGNQTPLTTQGSWQYFEYEITATSTTSSLIFYHPTETEFYLDDVKIELLDYSIESSNLSSNGDMESDDSWNDYSTVTVNEQSDVRVHEGNFSRHVVANYGGIRQTLSDLVTNSIYRVSGYYYLEAGSMTIYFFDNQTPLTTQGSWQYFEYNITATSTSTPLIFYHPTETEFYLDDVKVELLGIDGDVIAYSNPWPDLFVSGSGVYSGVVDGIWNANSTKRWTDNKWDWGNYDNLGFNTFYVGWTGGNPTGRDVEILAAVDSNNCIINLGATGHIINDAKFIGSNSYSVSLSESVQFNRCTFKYSDGHGINLGTYSGGNLDNTTIINSKFIDCGHRGINMVLPVNPLNVYNNYFYGCHLMLRNYATDDSVVNFINNSNYNALAGSIQWDTTSSLLNEHNNQFHIDYTSIHGGKRIAFYTGIPNWNLSDISDIPSDFVVTSICSGSPEMCGVNPHLVDLNGYPLYTSPLIDAGYSISGITTDYIGNPIYGTPDIGAYEYQPPYDIEQDDINISSPIRIYADGKYRYTDETSLAITADLSIIPQGGFSGGDYSQWMDVDIDTWNISGDYYKKWTETSSNHDLQTSHIIGNFKPNTRYALKVDGIEIGYYISDDSGTIAFTYGGGYSTKIFEIEESTGSVFVSPAKPNVSDIDIVSSEDGDISIENFPEDIYQIAISRTPDFENSYWRDFDEEKFKTIEQTYETLYVKFRTTQGAVSDVVVYKAIEGDLVDGDIVKTINNPDVYVLKIINNKKFKRLILSPSVFDSYGHLKWENIKIVSESQLDQYSVSNLVKETFDTTIYKLNSWGDTGTRTPFDLFDSYDTDSVYEINSIDRDSYKLG